MWVWVCGKANSTIKLACGVGSSAHFLVQGLYGLLCLPVERVAD